MEMNRYLIAALYVMAGCVVAVPLKVQGSPEPLRGERCRLVITATVKVVSQYVTDQEEESISWEVSPEYFWLPDIAADHICFSSAYSIEEQIQFPSYTSHKIRAPGEN